MKTVHIPDEEFIRKMMGTAPNAPTPPPRPIVLLDAANKVRVVARPPIPGKK